MPHMNNYAKFAVVNINLFYFWIGLVLLGLAVYLWVADWGEGLTEAFFLGTGIITALVGIIVMMVAFIGCQGVNNQTSKFGFWTGKKVMTIYGIFIFLAFLSMLILMSTALTNVNQFEITVDLLEADPNNFPPLTGIEPQIEEKFNEFFFGASSQCTEALYFWFWSWVNDNCPAIMNDESCQGCQIYSPTACAADAEKCYESSVPSYQQLSCPYTTCREGILRYMIKRMRPFGYACLGFLVFQSLLVVCVSMLICYHPKDTLEQILYKTGTISKERQMQIAMERTSLLA